MNQAQKAKYRATMKPIFKPLKTYHDRQIKKKRTVDSIARDFGVSGNSYRAWLTGKTIPDITSMHAVVPVLRNAGLMIGLPIMTYLNDHPPVKRKPYPKKRKKVAAKGHKKPRRQVKKKSEPVAKSTSSIEDMIRTMVQEEVRRVLDGVSVKIQA